MAPILLPAVWLIVLMVGLPQLSETVYTPSLPDIAKALATSPNSVEHTLTIYLFGFALGILFWGKISDSFGRKPCVIAGLSIFILGCIGCYLANSIEMLMLSRLIQAFGGSIGSVLGQAICRDVFHGHALGKVFATIASSLAIFPALGPLFGGLVAEKFGWENIFLLLLIFACILSALVMTKLPETHPHASRKKTSIWAITKELIHDKEAIGFALVAGGCNGILFSYFAEGPFYLINRLNLSPSQYGMSFILVATATFLGGMLAQTLHTYYAPKMILKYGLYIILIANTIFSLIILTNHTFWPLPTNMIIATVISSQMGLAVGRCMAMSSALSLALVNYGHAIGTASSLFGFFYYGLISGFTFFMGLLHNGTLVPMPFYFLAISCFMIVVNYAFLRENN